MPHALLSGRRSRALAPRLPVLPAARRHFGSGFLLVVLGLASAASVSAQIAIPAVDASSLSGGAVRDAANNHVLSNPANATRDVIGFTGVNFGAGYDTVEIELRLAYGSAGQRIDLRADSPTGSVIGTVFADATGARNQVYRLQTGQLNKSITGSRNLYVTIDDTAGLAPVRLRKLTLKNRGPLSTFLKQNGIYIRNDYGNGDIVRLYGVNLGGWAIQEPWMSPLAFNDFTPAHQHDQKGASDILSAPPNSPETARQILDAFYDSFITDTDFERIRAENLNCIRLPIYWRDYMNDDGEFKRRADDGQIDFRRIEAVVEHAKKNGIYVVIDLHGAPGSQNARDHSGNIVAGGVAGLWSSPANRAMTKNLWREIARRFRSEPAVAGYDILNEAAKDVAQKFWLPGEPDIRNFFTELYNVIREVDPDHIIFFDVWSEYDHVFNLTDDKDNIVLSYHWYVYDSFPGTEAAFWNERIQQFSVRSREGDGSNENPPRPFPVWIGEFSFKDHPVSSTWGDRMKMMTRYGLSWTKWNYKVRSGGGWGLYEANGTNDTNRLWVDDVSPATLLTKAAKWETGTYFTKNITVANSLKNAVALFGEPARPSLGGPLFGLTKDMPCTLNGVTKGATGWANFSPGDSVAIDAVDFGPPTDRFYANLHVDATLGPGETGGELEVWADAVGAGGTLLGSVVLNASNVSTNLLQRRPLGRQKIFLHAKRPGGTANIGLIKRVFFTEPPVVSLLGKSALKFGSVQSSDSTLATTASAAGDREDYFLLTTTADPLSSTSFTTALLSRKTMKWIGVDSAADNILKATVAYDNAAGSLPIATQRNTAPKFDIASTGDGDYRSIKAKANDRYVQIQGGDGPLKAKHAGPGLGSHEKFELVFHNH